MAHQISEVCIACGACKEVCPVDAVTEGTPFKIDPDICIDCGACASECPVNAITQV